MSIHETPFARTIIFQHDDYYAKAAATLAAQAQLVPLFGPAPDDLVESVKYLSPYLVVMGQLCSDEQLQAFLTKGFTKVQIFDPKFDDEYDDDAKVAKFGIAHSTVLLNIQGLAATLIMERLACCKYKHYVSNVTTKDEAKWTKHGLFATGNFVGTIDRIANTWNGLLLLDEITLNGKVLTTLQQNIAKERIERFLVPAEFTHEGKTYKIATICAMDFVKHTARALRDAKTECGDRYDFGLIYRYDATHGGYHLLVVPGAAEDAVQVVKSVVGEELPGSVVPAKKLYQLIPCLS